MYGRDWRDFSAEHEVGVWDYVLAGDDWFLGGAIEYLCFAWLEKALAGNGAWHNRCFLHVVGILGCILPGSI